MTKNVFYGAMLDILILHKNIQEELTKLIEDLPVILIMIELSFLCKKKILARSRYGIIFALTCLVMRISWFFRFLFISKNSKIQWIYYFYLRTINRIMCIKDFRTFMFRKTKNKNKKWFCKSCLQCFSGKNILIKHKEDCLSINGRQFVDVQEGLIKFENYSKQLPVPFKIYADFECNLEDTEIKALAQKNIMIMFLAVMRIRLSVLMIDLVSRLLVIEVKMLLMNLLKQFLKNISTAKT